MPHWDLGTSLSVAELVRASAVPLVFVLCRLHFCLTVISDCLHTHLAPGPILYLSQGWLEMWYALLLDERGSFVRFLPGNSRRCFELPLGARGGMSLCGVVLLWWLLHNWYAQVCLRFTSHELVKLRPQRSGGNNCIMSAGVTLWSIRTSDIRCATIFCCCRRLDYFPHSCLAVSVAGHGYTQQEKNCQDVSRQNAEMLDAGGV